MDPWFDLCRCCLSTKSVVSLLDPEKNVTEKFLEVTTIEVTEDDGLPNKLCSSCYGAMNSAYQFRKQCIKVDGQLRLQFKLCSDMNKSDKLIPDTPNDLSDVIENKSMTQLEAIIKQEQIDTHDDDSFYVLVIQDPKEKPKEEQQPLPDIKIKEIEHKETDSYTQEITQCSQLEDFVASLLMTNTKVSANVPATVLENGEESHATGDTAVNIDETEDMAQDQGLEMEQTQDNQNIETISTDIIKDLPNSKNIIKVLSTSNCDGTILLKSNDGIQYLSDSQLVTNEDEDGLHHEVIFCEGDDSSPIQVLKYDGSEFVVEYVENVENNQIATILQQEDGTYLCDCGVQFADLAECEKHQYKHNAAGEHLCNLCGKGFDSAEILMGHMLLHSNTGLQITCPLCKQLVKRNALTQHIKYSHNQIKPSCEICSKTFANPNNLKRHMMIHSGIRKFECDICFKRFHQKITMQTHRLTHMNPFSCNQCDRTFENKNELTNHKESNECSKSKIIKIKEELMKTVKQEITTNLGKLLGYACSLCKKIFSVESALEQHIEGIHIVDPAELLCSECGEVLPSKKDMQSHILRHKNLKVKNAKRFECSTCGKGCSSHAMLLMHERVHTNERPFACQLCSLHFKTKTHLRTHQLTHTREKKFGCSVCMKFFALKGNLVVHLRTHTGERPYVCSVCNEGFIDSKYLKKHKLKKHRIENASWGNY